MFTTEDITGRLERERELEQYETVVETAHDGIYVFDEERRFELVNESFVDLTSLSRSELLGQHASTVFGDEFASIEAEQWERATPDELPSFEETIYAGPNETRTVENRFVLLDEDARERASASSETSRNARSIAESWRSQTNGWNSSRTPPVTTSRSRCGWSRATSSCSSGATATNSTRMPRSSSTTRLMVPNGCGR
uniref:PAS domain-containing protein n=1 Tax=Natrinema halophilum TaxID=1699371 RepID=A0A7D5KWH6_9EURY